ncbi:MAG: biopolymer transporter ExbD [Rudaea sp.]|uniref:ExbD/TolR family protein n=1 Tax=Rudaea sp. TaxID=2136325 RepID=UPI0039E4F97A
MRLGSARQDDFEINVISLIDVLLTLLMFFVMTTTFVQHSAMKVTLPEASETAGEPQREALVVMVDADGRYFVDNNEVLNPALDTLKEAIARVAGADRERPVVLRADAASRHQAVVTAMDALGQLGFTRLSIATTRAKDAAGKPAGP